MEHRVAQASLFNEKDAADKGSVFSDPAFSGNKRLPIHRWVPWIAGYSQQFVQDALKRYLPTQGTVLDPFAGVGTTLVEAILSGHQALGFEINPYAALACRTKLNACTLDPQTVRAMLTKFWTFYELASKDSYTPDSTPPPGFKTRGSFYSPKVLHKVLGVQDFIANLEEGLLQDLFRVAFGATMITYSNYSYEPSLGRRSTAGKADIEDFPVGETIAQKLTDMAQDIEWMQRTVEQRASCQRGISRIFLYLQEPPRRRFSRCAHHLAPLFEQLSLQPQYPASPLLVGICRGSLATSSP